MISVFDYHDYKKFLEQSFEERKQVTPGVQRLFAEALGCQPSFVSQILKGKSQLSPEQALPARRFLRLSFSEGEYFMLLVHHARAGTAELRAYLEDQMKERRREFLNMKNRFQIDDHLSVVDEAQYFSSWLYAAVHVATSIPAGNSIEGLCRLLNQPEDAVVSALEFLLAKSMVTQGPQGYSMGVTRLHLGQASPVLIHHHSNWRMRAIQRIQSKNTADEVHYTSVISLSNADLESVKRLFVDAIERSKKIVKEAPANERLVCMLLDFFEIN